MKIQISDERVFLVNGWIPSLLFILFFNHVFVIFFLSDVKDRQMINKTLSGAQAKLGCV